VRMFFPQASFLQDPDTYTLALMLPNEVAAAALHGAQSSACDTSAKLAPEIRKRGGVVRALGDELARALETVAWISHLTPAAPLKCALYSAESPVFEMPFFLPPNRKPNARLGSILLSAKPDRTSPPEKW
jgi:hypothetical protein